MLSKTDYLLYLDAPLHLWAYKHGKMDHVILSRHDQHLMNQGQEVEKLAREFLQNQIQLSPTPLELAFQSTVTDRHFQTRLDALVYDPTTEVYDIYEIKSASSVKKEHLYDAAFQRLVAEANFPVRNTFLLHINKEYTRSGELELDDLFQIVNVNEETENLREELLSGRETAWQVANLDSPDGIDECLKPKSCPCLSLCHPILPDYSIYNLPRLHKNKTLELKSAGILDTRDIPDSYPLSENQKAHAQVVQTGRPRIETDAIRAALDKLEFPLYFLDYETFNPAVPEFDGYSPYQHIVFQYSLDIFSTPEAQPDHHEFLSTDQGDPAKPLLEHLLERIGTQGSVIVWNQAFEAGRNREMAARYPQHAGRLENINKRIFDLMLIFSRGNYLHPDFHGSASIKNVLPVLVEDLTYDGLPIPQGDEAMMAWVDIMKGSLSPDEIKQTKKDLLRYCALDTLAMVKIWQVLKDLVFPDQLA